MRIKFLSKKWSPVFSRTAAFAAGCLSTGTAVLLFHYQEFFSLSIKNDYTTQSKLNGNSSKTFVDSTDFQRPPVTFGFQSKIPEVVASVGLPISEGLKIFPGFISLYDRRFKIPRWTLELITPESLNVDIVQHVDRSKFEFFEDKSEPQLFRSTNSDYIKSGFDRGHMAAAGNHISNDYQMQSSFVLSNIAPQVGDGFNRHIWNDLEKYIRGIARRNQNVVIITGPLFLPQPLKAGEKHRWVKFEVIGANNVYVPTHFFKAVAVQDWNNHWKTYAWVLPNQNISKEMRVNAFSLSIKDVEKAAGLQLFPNLN